MGFVFACISYLLSVVMTSSKFNLTLSLSAGFKQNVLFRLNEKLTILFCFVLFFTEVAVIVLLKKSFPPLSGKGSSSISSDISSGTDHTPTKAPKNVTTSEGKASGAHY